MTSAKIPLYTWHTCMRACNNKCNLVTTTFVYVCFVVFRCKVHQVATDQVFETFSHLGHKKSLPALRNAAASGNTSQLENLANAFSQDAKRLQEVNITGKKKDNLKRNERDSQNNN